MSNDVTQSIYEPPKSNLEVEKTDSAHQFFSVSYKKLYVMFVMTFGLYALVLFYQNWKLQKKRHELRVNPVLRSLFAIFFTHSLFARIKETVRKQKIDVAFNNNAMATLYIVSVLVSNGLDRVAARSDDVTLVDVISTMVMMIALYPLHVAQTVINQINGEIDGQRNSDFSVYNWMFIVLGAMLWVLLLIGILASFTSVLDGLLV
ncbi:hypothetical protein [Kaarinaea lacus]